MSKVKFTEEQQQELRNNKYTASVTTKFFIIHKKSLKNCSITNI